MHSFVCELLTRGPHGGKVLAETQVFLAPNAITAIDRAKHWAEMEPWIAEDGAMLRLVDADGHPVWARELAEAAVV
jgi:hypothetical protein